MSLIQRSVASNWLRAASLCCILAIVVLSLIPGKWQARTGAPGPFEHFVAYFFTAAGVGWSTRSRLHPAYAVIGLAGLAGLMEILQNWSPGRDPAVIDVVSGGLGAGVGALLAYWARGRFEVT